MKEGLRIHARLELPADELEVSYARSGGPGGQNVNKVETKVVLSFSIEASQVLGERRKSLLRERLSSRLTNDGRLIVTSSKHRERARNEADARERLARILAKALEAPRVRKATKPTRGSQRRRVEEKRKRSDTKRLRGRIGRDEG